MTLPEIDVTYLRERGLAHEATLDGNMLCVVIPNFQVPPGLSTSQSDLLIRLSPGYPDVTPDMWWFSPAVSFKDGRNIPQTEVVENYLGRAWQRWSRHFDQGRWKPGVDSIESFLAVIRGDLSRYASQAA